MIFIKNKKVKFWRYDQASHILQNIRCKTLPILLHGLDRKAIENLQFKLRLLFWKEMSSTDRVMSPLNILEL